MKKAEIIEIFKSVVGRDPEGKDMPSIESFSNNPIFTKEQIEQTYQGLKEAEDYTKKLLAKEAEEKKLDQQKTIPELPVPVSTVPPPAVPKPTPPEPFAPQLPKASEQNTVTELSVKTEEPEPPEPDDETIEVSYDDLKKMNVPALKKLAKELGLKFKKGQKVKKADLIKNIWKKL